MRKTNRTLESARRRIALVLALIVWAVTSTATVDANAQARLVSGESVPIDAPATPVPSPGQPTTDATATLGTPGVKTTDTVVQVIRARDAVGEAMVRKQKALLAVREAVLAGKDDTAAQAELTAATQGLIDATAATRKALEANHAENLAVAQQELVRIHGPDGPSLTTKVGNGIGITGASLVGTVAGTTVGVKDSLVGLGYAVLHPIQTGKAIVDAFNQPPLSKEQEVANDIAQLTDEREQLLARARAPIATALSDSYLLGRDVMGPLVAGELLGGIGGVVGKASGPVVGRAAAPVIKKAETALTAEATIPLASGTRQIASSGTRPLTATEQAVVAQGGRVPLGEGSFSLGFREGNEVLKLIKSDVPGPTGMPVRLTDANRIRLANETITLTNRVADGLGGGVVPKMQPAGEALIRQPFAGGKTIGELEALGDPLARLNAFKEMNGLVEQARRIVPNGELAGGWQYGIDINPANFRFNNQGQVTSWFDPVAIFPRGTPSSGPIVSSNSTVPLIRPGGNSTIPRELTVPQQGPRVPW